MTFLWPQMLLLLLLVPALVGGYVWLLRRKKKEALRYARWSLVKEAIGPGQTVRRHLPPLMLLLSLIAAVVAIARPTAVITLPSKQQTIIMAMDVSLSMGARDVDPNRITAAQAAAKAFVADHPPEVQIGIGPFGPTGPDPLDAAHWAADHGVRVFTVGFGTAEGGTIGFGGWSAYVRLDEETLKAIADITHGEYFYAGTAADLAKVYQALNARLVLEKKDTEITALFSAAAAALALGAAAFSLLWFRRIAYTAGKTSEKRLQR